jgi:endonuclease YncB( thermonuclease family)
MPTHRDCAIGFSARRPHGAPRCLLVPAILGALAFTPALAASARKSAGPPPTCVLETVASGTVQTIVDGTTFVLADGREVRLAGIEVPSLPGPNQAAPAEASTTAAAPESPPPDPGLAAAAALRDLLNGQEVILKHPKLVNDRYGRILADALVSHDGGAVSAAKTLLAQGLARVAARPGEAACAAELRTIERTARAAKLGVWADPRYFPKQADNPAGVAAERGRFTLVEGKVVSVRESGGTIYINFGRRWSEDFTVTILKRNERLFTAAGLEPRALAGRRVMVRGWIEERGGPWIDAAGPEQIEIIAER